MMLILCKKKVVLKGNNNNVNKVLLKEENFKAIFKCNILFLTPLGKKKMFLCQREVYWYAG